MKKRKLLPLVLLFVMSFQVVHAFAIEILDVNECHISEYIGETTHIAQTQNDDNDICKLHAAFHHSFLIPETTLVKYELFAREVPDTFIPAYEYDIAKNFLIPPRLS